MKQNITLYIGDNASGKTQALKKIIKESKDKNMAVVTNLAGYQMDYAADIHKKRLLASTNNRIVNRIFDGEIDTSYKAKVEKLLKLLYSSGEVLVLDELDSGLTVQDVVDMSAAIAYIRGGWRKIFINGYSNYLLRLFIDIDKESYTEKYYPKVIYIDNLHKEHILAEEEIDEYFDKIRG